MTKTRLFIIHFIKETYKEYEKKEEEEEYNVYRLHEVIVY